MGRDRTEQNTFAHKQKRQQDQSVLNAVKATVVEQCKFQDIVAELTNI